VPMGLCAVSRWSEGVQKQKQSAGRLGSHPNFKTDHAGFSNPVPPRSNPESTIGRQEFVLYFNMDMGDSPSDSLSAAFRNLDRNAQEDLTLRYHTLMRH
jgi:hypothetical protein